jgi:hypothetical protein
MTGAFLADVRDFSEAFSAYWCAKIAAALIAAIGEAERVACLFVAGINCWELALLLLLLMLLLLLLLF